MCEGMPIIFVKDLKCATCGKGPAFQIDEHEEEETYCRPCAIHFFGEKLVLEMEQIEPIIEESK